MQLGAIRGWFKQKWRGVRFERSLWETEVREVHECFTELLSMEGRYAVKLSIIVNSSSRLVGNEGNVIMVAYGKCKCGLTPSTFFQALNSIRVTFQRMRESSVVISYL